jgi:hypothetical protein
MGAVEKGCDAFCKINSKWKRNNHKIKSPSRSSIKACTTVSIISSLSPPPLTFILFIFRRQLLPTIGTGIMFRRPHHCARFVKYMTTRWQADNRGPGDITFGADWTRVFFFRIDLNLTWRIMLILHCICRLLFLGCMLYYLLSIFSTHHDDGNVQSKHCSLTLRILHCIRPNFLGGTGIPNNYTTVPLDFLSVSSLAPLIIPAF